MAKISIIFRKNIYFFLVLALFALGAFLRFYHFSDWLHFELDQSRDAIVIDLAVKEGTENLPLLGPKAGGSFLRLGPVFYYFNYLSALVFGNTPSGIAAITVIFGILAIPVFYLLIRRYFEKRIALSLLAIFSASLFLVVYSRFSWNPNPLVLFGLLSMFCLLKLVEKENKNRGLWLIFLSLSLAVATQMHFLALVSLPIISLLFLLIKKPEISIKYWTVAAFLLALLYFPAILNDFKTGGKNFGQIFSVAEKKSNKSEHNLGESLYKNVAEQSLGYSLILSGYEYTDLPRLNLKKTSPYFEFICDKKCWRDLPAGISSAVFFLLGFFVLVGKLLSVKKIQEQRKKDFLILMNLWFVVSFILFLPLAFDISPRFYLLVSGLPFIFLGLLAEKFFSLFFRKRIAYLVFTILTLGLVGLNLFFVFQRFDQQRRAPKEAVRVERDRILREEYRVTLELQYKVVDYLEKIYQEKKLPVYIKSEPYYERALLYNLEQRGISNDNLKTNLEDKKVYRRGSYYLIFPTLSNKEDRLKKYENYYDFIDEKTFGTLTVKEVFPREIFVNSLEENFEIKDKFLDRPGVPQRYRWEEIFRSTEEEQSEKG